MADDKAARKAARADKRAQKKADKAAPGAPPAACDPSQVERSTCLHLPAALTARQRAVLHQAADAAGLPHESHGDGDERRLVLGDPSAATVVRLPDDALTDEQLAAALQQHLRLSAAELVKPPARGHSAPLSLRSVPLRRSALTVDAFLTATAEHLELERQAEIQQATEVLNTHSPEGAQAKGQSLLKLVCSEIEGGLLGKTLLTLVSSRGGAAGDEVLPQHKMGPHDVVAIREAKAASAADALLQGIVYRVTDSSIVVAVDEIPEDADVLHAHLRLDKLANQVTYDRMRDVLTALGSSSGQQAGRPLMDVAFGLRPPNFAADPPPWAPVNVGLDASQRAAVSLALSAQDVALIHGPPGTGKTTAVVEAIVQEVARGARVLACAASNIAVDNLVERVARAQPKLKVVRLGHPARLLPEVLHNSLEAHVMRSDNSSLASDCRAEIRELNRRLLKLTRRERAERREIQAELRTLSKEEKQRQHCAVREVLDAAHVVCCTLTGVGSSQLRGQPFDVVYVDEAAQALEVACWGALLRARRCILAGDHQQLPPTIVSAAAAKQGLGVTLFERLHAMYGADVSQMLSVQYRMHDDIMTWASREMYGGKLTAHDLVARHCLGGLPHVDGADDEDLAPLVMFDTSGCDMEEAVEAEGGSRYNEGEAACAVLLIKRYLAVGLRPEEVGVITPYSAQASRVKRALVAEGLRNVEVSTVDGFQGREKEAIVISTVRSNAKGEVGFLADRRRMNVAVTRARRQCVLLCNSETVGRDPFLATLVAHFEAAGSYRSADELAQG